MKMFPFPRKENFKYENFPWYHPKDRLKEFDASTVEEWIDSDSMPYMYDPADLITFDLIAEKAKELQHHYENDAIHEVQMTNVQLHGIGEVNVLVRMTRKGNDASELYRLYPIHVFGFDSGAECIACQTRKLTLSWEIVEPASPFDVSKGISLERAVFVRDDGTQETFTGDLSIDAPTTKRNMLSSFPSGQALLERLGLKN
jgi:hypothetical protein